MRKEINKTISSLKPEAFCSSKEQICVQGPPGIQGSKGSRGKRGPRGNTGRKGSRGFTGDPGPHGEQGIQGSPGQKGAQGEKGVPGPRGYPGAKGDAGESVSAPAVVISPMTQTLRENQTAIFRCSATGNPKPSVTWFRSDRNWTGHFRYQSDGRLEVRGVSLTEAGAYTCVAKNVLGGMNQSAILIVEAPPRVQLAPGPTYVKTGASVTLHHCKVTGFPFPVATWRKLGGVLATERAVYGEGSLTMVGARKADTGLYQCRAKNNLGESYAFTTLVVWAQPKFILRPPSRANKRIGQNLILNCKVSDEASISWRRVGGAWIEHRMKVENGTLEISSLKKSDSGSYICEAKLLFSTIRATTTLQVDFIPLNLTTNGRKGRFGVIQSFTVSTTGQYQLKAWGARGGTHSYNYGYKPGTYYGGKGALKEGTFTLTKGTVLKIVVGHRGGDSVEVKGGRYTSKTSAELGLSVEDNAGTGILQLMMM
ncbi:contactin-5-like isoform X2 [Acropora palmata]|uniref:contactin-5-like isoform X2 n=1 Tax=Acropora palmata TaxID=6131 RepID=UPI003DA152D1